MFLHFFKKIRKIRKKNKKNFKNFLTNFFFLIHFIILLSLKSSEKSVASEESIFWRTLTTPACIAVRSALRTRCRADLASVSLTTELSGFVISVSVNGRMRRTGGTGMAAISGLMSTSKGEGLVVSISSSSSTCFTVDRQSQNYRHCSIDSFVSRAIVLRT